MVTRFSNGASWVTADGRAVEIVDMETNHIINTLRMFKEKPARTMAMLINDVESYSQCVFSCDSYGFDRESLVNITSMTAHELIEYAMRSPLALAMIKELSKRGVNVDNALSIENGASADIPLG